jgi:putative peptidoglycan lipid II flippase
VVPSAIAFLVLGDVVAAAIYQTGNFHREHSIYVWKILAGSAVGLVASTIGRLYSSAYFALRDTRTPLRFAVIRVVLTTGLGYLCALPLPRWLGIDPSWGTAGLTASAGFSAWVEFLLLRRGMNRRIGHSEFPVAYFVKLWTSAIAAAGLAWGLRFLVRPHHPVITGIVILIPYGGVYLALTAALGIDQTATLYRRLVRRSGRA